MDTPPADIALHTCCAPCLIEPYRLLADEYGAVVPVFFNPNIAPDDEYERRRAAFRQYCERFAIPGVELSGDRRRWQEVLAQPLEDEEGGYVPHLSEPETPRRCEPCYRMRLEKVIRWAVENGSGGFATTLTVSPDQQREAIERLARELCRRHGLTYVGRDFSDRYLEATRISRQLGLYRQNYCGCTPRGYRMERDEEETG
jgi:predicted adenine nucleotide alpha hydrolase (AANH) superfamily ATPase